VLFQLTDDMLDSGFPFEFRAEGNLPDAGILAISATSVTKVPQLLPLLLPHPHPSAGGVQSDSVVK
jgi:hypothetical protein